MRRASKLVALSLLAVGALLTWRSPPAAVLSHAKFPRVEVDDEAAAQCSVRPMKLPTGGPARLSCRDARRVIAEVHGRLAAPVSTSPTPPAFARALTGWLDPHGLWSAAPDALPRVVIERVAARLIRELVSSSRDGETCAAAREVATVTQRWVAELTREYARAPMAAARTPAEAWDLAAQSVYQDDPVTRPARSLARDLGARARAFERYFGNAGGARVAADDRLLPQASVDEWTAAVLAAAVRAYVPAVDAHGQWAPLDEEWSLYASDAVLDVGPRLWGRMMRTALGVRVLDDPTPPLAEGDLVLSVGGIATAGLSVEQAEQLSRLETVGGELVRDVVVLRRGERAPRTLSVALTEPAPQSSESPTLDVELVGYGGGKVAVIAILDVPDDLGDELARTVSELAGDEPPPVGIVLDLRGNGGGSIDGAAGAIGVFLASVPSFPLKRRDGAIEIQHATVTPGAARWVGPVATLVDGYTASAAEMIAGALSKYDRGPVLGARTFGKGCVQEYFDDRTGVGVLRLTTMLFALPDGAPLQGVGVEPDFPLGLPPPRERERTLPATMPTWRGPDVRRAAALGGPAWPSHGGRIGPCSAPVVCQALTRLGRAEAPRRSAASRAPTLPRRMAR